MSMPTMLWPPFYQSSKIPLGESFLKNEISTISQLARALPVCDARAHHSAALDMPRHCHHICPNMRYYIIKNNETVSKTYPHGNERRLGPYISKALHWLPRNADVFVRSLQCNAWTRQRVFMRAVPFRP